MSLTIPALLATFAVALVARSLVLVLGCCLMGEAPLLTLMNEHSKLQAVWTGKTSASFGEELWGKCRDLHALDQPVP